MDTTANFLTIIKNGYLAKMKSVTTDVTKMRLEIARLLKEEGFVEDFIVTEAKPSSKMTVILRYFDKIPAITNLKKVSKSSVRIYAPHNKIPQTLSGAGTTIVSTPSGLMTGKTAFKKHLGGEVICQIW